MDFDAPDSRFDPNSLSRSEKILVQAALSLTKDYFDELDGLWGPNSAKALREYYKRLEKTDKVRFVPNWAVMFLVAEAVVEFRANGWGEFYFPDSNMSLYAPDIELVEKKSFDVYEGTTTELELHYTTAKKSLMRKFHRVAKQNAKELSKIRSNRHWITYLARGSVLHFVYSQRNGDRWATFSILAKKEDFGRLNLMLPSIRTGKPGLISVSRRFSLLTDSFLEKLEEEQRQEQAKSRPKGSGQPPQDQQPPSGSGTGFAVSADGYLLTNAHVVQGCQTLEVKGRPATLVASDTQFDLALLHVPGLPVKNTAKFANSPASLNSDITVAGYPLSGLLSGLNVTRGSVTSLKGLAGNGANMQISAPVQPGNSGGPAVNAQGAIVGVVVAKLNATQVADAIGDIPQNVNFAIRGTIAQLFLHQNGVAPEKIEGEAILRPEEIASQLSGYTHLIKCI